MSPARSRLLTIALAGVATLGALGYLVARPTKPSTPHATHGSEPAKKPPSTAKPRRRPIERLSVKKRDPGFPVTITREDGNDTLFECQELTREQIIERGPTSYNTPGIGTGTNVRWDALGCLDAGCGVGEEGGPAWGTRIVHFVRREGKPAIGGRCETPIIPDFTKPGALSARFFVDRSVLESTAVFAIGLNADVFHPRYETNVAVINLRKPDRDDQDRDGNRTELGPAELRLGAPRRSKSLPLEPFIDHWTEITVTIKQRKRKGPSEHLCTFAIRREEGDGEVENMRFRDIPCDLPPRGPWELVSHDRTESRLVSGLGGGRIVINSRAGATRQPLHDGTSIPFEGLAADSAGRDDGFILVDRISWRQSP